MLKCGDEVIVCSGSITGYLPELFSIVKAAGLIPHVYEGVRIWVGQSSIDRELRDDFYKAKLRVVYIDYCVKDSVVDNWAINELRYIQSNELLIYASTEIPANNLKKLALPVDPILVASAQEFVNDFRFRLDQLLEKPSSVTNG